MALSIMTNVGSLNAQRNLSKTQSSLSANLGRLSSGLRINQAGDDAAGLAISEKLKSQIRSMSQAERNANDGVSLLQTAEGAMNEVSGILTRMRELAVQSGNATVGDTERGFLNDEFSALSAEIDRIAEVTEFNGTSLIDGSVATGGLTFQVGIHATTNDTISVTMDDMHASALGGTTSVSGGLSALDISSVTGASDALAVIDQAISDVSEKRATLGSTQNRLQITIANLASSRENLAAANSRIRDVDVAEETASMTRNNILMQAGVAVLAQANQLPSMALSLIG